MILLDVPIIADVLILIYDGDAANVALEESASAAQIGERDEACTWMRVADAINSLQPHLVAESTVYHGLLTEYARSLELPVIIQNVPLLADELIRTCQGDAVLEALERSISASEAGAHAEAHIWVRVAAAIRRSRAPGEAGKLNASGLSWRYPREGAAGTGPLHAIWSWRTRLVDAGRLMYDLAADLVDMGKHAADPTPTIESGHIALSLGFARQLRCFACSFVAKLTTELGHYPIIIEEKHAITLWRWAKTDGRSTRRHWTARSHANLAERSEPARRQPWDRCHRFSIGRHSLVRAQSAAVSVSMTGRISPASLAVSCASRA